MAGGKTDWYPITDAGLVSTIATARATARAAATKGAVAVPPPVAVASTSETYMKQIVSNFDIGIPDQVHVRAGKDMRHSAKSKLYDEFAMTVQAIDAGGDALNKTPTAVRDASIQLMEECRLRLLELEDADMNYGIDPENEAEKEVIFSTLKNIRLANNRESSQKFAMDFASSLGTQMKEAATKENIKSAMFRLGAFVIVATLLAVFFTPAAPFVILAAVGIALYGVFKMLKGVYNAWQYATKKGNEEKVEAGKFILDKESEIAPKALVSAELELAAAEASVAEAKQTHTKAKTAFEQYVKTKIKPISEENGRLTTLIGVVTPLINALDRVEIERELVADWGVNGPKIVAQVNVILEALGETKLDKKATKDHILAAVDALSGQLATKSLLLKEGEVSLAAAEAELPYKELKDKAADTEATLKGLAKVVPIKQQNYDSAFARNEKQVAVAAKREAQSSLKERLKAAAPPPKTAVATPVVDKKFKF